MLRAHLAERPLDAEAWFLNGTAEQRLGRDAAASAAFRRAIALAPRDIRPHAALGAMLGAAGDAAGALVAFRKALAVEPHNPRLLTNAAIALEALNQDTEALACYDRALETFPGFGDARQNRCLLRLKRGDPQMAAADARQLINSFPDLALGYELLGACELALGRTRAAQANYQQALALDPESRAAKDDLDATARGQEDANDN